MRVPHHHRPIFVPHPQVALVSSHDSDGGWPGRLQLLVVVDLHIVPVDGLLVKRIMPRLLETAYVHPVQDSGRTKAACGCPGPWS